MEVVIGMIILMRGAVGIVTENVIEMAEILGKIIDQFSKADQVAVLTRVRVISSNKECLLDHICIHHHKGLLLPNTNLEEHLGCLLLHHRFIRCPHHLLDLVNHT